PVHAFVELPRGYYSNSRHVRYLVAAVWLVYAPRGVAFDKTALRPRPVPARPYHQEWLVLLQALNVPRRYLLSVVRIFPDDVWHKPMKIRRFGHPPNEENPWGREQNEYVQ